MKSQRQRSFRHRSLEQAATDILRSGGWRVLRQPHAGIADFLIQRNDRKYVVELKSSAEARRDRLVPLLAQAILEAKSAAARFALEPNAAPLAIIGVPRLSQDVINYLRSFAAEVASDVAIGIVDLEGARFFAGAPDLEDLSSLPPRGRKAAAAFQAGSKLNLFSDLNQWILKVLLAPAIPEHLLSAPRQLKKNASDLARAAQVSIMSAFRCVDLLRAEGFLDEHSDVLRLVNVERLLNRWRTAAAKPVREIPMRWVLPGDGEQQLSDALRQYVARYESLGGSRNVQSQEPRVALGLFAAADALGLGFVRGVAPHLYIERIDHFVLQRLGVAPVDAAHRVDLFIRIPHFREAAFRGAVMRDGVPVSDVVQIWLDVADHPSRGADQAQEIWRRIFARLRNDG